jgi:hypothetical protein
MNIAAKGGNDTGQIRRTAGAGKPFLPFKPDVPVVPVFQAGFGEYLKGIHVEKRRTVQGHTADNAVV